MHNSTSNHSQSGFGNPTQTVDSTFSIEEQQAFHTDDISTGKTVISLLTIIFFLGLLLYIAVIYYVMAAPQPT